MILFTVAYSFAQISAGCVDAAMNAPATVFYKDRAGSLVSFHSIFNIGALVGALFSALAIANGISWRWLWPTVAVLAALTALTARLGAPGDILDADQVPHAIVLTPVGESPSAPREKTRSLRHDGLLVFLIVFALAEVTEGGAFTWGVLYLRHFLRAGIYVGAIAYIIGHVVAALSRGVGGTKMRSIPVGRAFVFGSLLCAAGLCIEVATHISIIAAVGLALATAGTSLFWPLVMSSIASRSSSPGRAVGSFTAAGYVGWVAGAPLIGYMSDALGPKAGLLSMAVICVIVIVAVLAGALPTNQDHAQSAGKVSS